VDGLSSISHQVFHARFMYYRSYPCFSILVQELDYSIQIWIEFKGSRQVTKDERWGVPALSSMPKGKLSVLLAGAGIRFFRPIRQNKQLSPVTIARTIESAPMHFQVHRRVAGRVPMCKDFVASSKRNQSSTSPRERERGQERECASFPSVDMLLMGL
jgi:hypothetical protein